MSFDDTYIGGSQDKFPDTMMSAIQRIQNSDSKDTLAFDAIVRGYWKPVYKYIRIKWNKSNEDAKDLTQEFFTRVLEKDFIGSFDANKAKFRTFLKTCLDGFIANEEKAAKRIKRGGNVAHISLDFDSADNEFKQVQIPDNANVDAYFEQEWIRSIFEIAVNRLRNEMSKKGKDIYFKLFEQYDLTERKQGEKISYIDVAEQFELSTTNVTNYLSAARREFRKIVLAVLREITANESEFLTESKKLFGQT